MSSSSLRLWLSGSIPESINEEEKKRIEDFVDAFCAKLFREGGTLVHGSDPSLSPIIHQAAKRVFDSKNESEKCRLVNVVSRHWSKDWTQETLDSINTFCVEPVIETMESLVEENGSKREPSLRVLRKTLVEQANAYVALGGKWWEVDKQFGSVPKELELAQAHGLPTFILSGLGGATKGYAEEQPELFKKCRNGLDVGTNNELADSTEPREIVDRVVNQLKNLPLQERSSTSGRPFRILSLDGGGIRGAYTASVLSYWEKQTGLKAVDHFDMIAGTSTGGILAIGLGLGMSADQMLKFYREEGNDIFPCDTGFERWWHNLKHWFSAKFDRNTLKQKLEDAYENRGTFEDSKCRLVITAYNNSIDKPVIFRTPHGPFANTDKGINPVTVALSTAAAPTYFGSTEIEGTSTIDGGVWANCPGLVAISEAVGKLGVSIDQIEMLSIGTTSTPTHDGKPLLVDQTFIGKVIEWSGAGRLSSTLCKLLWKPVRVEGKVGWVANIAGLLMKTQGQTIEYACKSILGDRFLRVDYSTPKIELDEADKIAELVKYGEESGEEFAEVVTTRFMNGIPAANWKQR